MVLPDDFDDLNPTEIDQAWIRPALDFTPPPWTGQVLDAADRVRPD